MASRVPTSANTSIAAAQTLGCCSCSNNPHRTRVAFSAGIFRANSVARIRTSVSASPNSDAMNGMIAVGNAHKEKVKLTFLHGAALPDPDKLFNAGFGGGKWRAIDALEGDKIDEAALKALVRAAIAHNRTKVKKKKPATPRVKVKKGKPALKRSRVR